MGVVGQPVYSWKLGTRLLIPSSAYSCPLEQYTQWKHNSTYILAPTAPLKPPWKISKPTTEQNKTHKITLGLACELVCLLRVIVPISQLVSVSNEGRCLGLGKLVPEYQTSKLARHCDNLWK